MWTGYYLKFVSLTSKDDIFQIECRHTYVCIDSDTYTYTYTYIRFYFVRGIWFRTSMTVFLLQFKDVDSDTRTRTANLRCPEVKSRLYTVSSNILV